LTHSRQTETIDRDKRTRSIQAETAVAVLQTRRECGQLNRVVSFYTQGNFMKSWRARRFGTPKEALTIEELEIPAPGDGQVAIKVRAASVALPDLLMIKGQHPLVKSTPFSPGIEVVGIVSAIGNGAPFAIGDRVMTTTAYASGWGGFAEYCLADATKAVHAPSHMRDVEAAGFLVPYKNAYVALVQRAVLRQGETLLVLGATGTSGAAAIQFAKALDARVIAVSSSSEKLKFCRAIGADDVINYKTDDVLDRVNELTQGKGADVIFDPVGGTLGNLASKAIARHGRFLLIGFASGSWVQLDPLDIVVRDYSVVGVFSGRLTPEELAHAHSEVLLFAQEGRINVPIGKVFPFKEVPTALAYLTRDDLFGRLIIEIS
jgi:NADPH2:quinone reductase